jgi:hypothetical protein
MSATATVSGSRPVSVNLAHDGTDRPPAQSGQDTRTGARRSPGRPGLRALAGLADLVISFAVPLLAYDLIRPHVGSSALALALAGAIPVVYTLATLAVTRRLNPVAVVGVISFGLGVLVSWASGGSALALELEDPVLFGLIGAAFLGSLAVGRPLHTVILRWLGRGNPQYAAIASRAERKTSVVVTAIIGVTLLAHSAAVAVLALTQSTGTFVNLQHAVGLPVFALGLACLLFYRSRLQARQARQARPVPEGRPGEAIG